MDEIEWLASRRRSERNARRWSVSAIATSSLKLRPTSTILDTITISVFCPFREQRAKGPVLYFRKAIRPIKCFKLLNVCLFQDWSGELFGRFINLFIQTLALSFFFHLCTTDQFWIRILYNSIIMLQFPYNTNEDDYADREVNLLNARANTHAYALMLWRKCNFLDISSK